MVEGSERNIIDYILESNRGEIIRKGERETNFIKIDDKRYRYNRNNPISDTLKKKLNKVKKTIEYKRHELINKTDARWLKVDKNKALKALIAIQRNYTANIRREQAFGNYANTYSITDIKVRGLKGLSYIKYQEPNLKQYIQEKKGMKIWMEMFATFIRKNTGDEIDHITRTRLYEITNVEEIKPMMNQMATDLEVHYDKYNPTRGGSFIELPDWVEKKKACINIQNTDNKCFKYSVQCGVYKVYEKDHACKVHHYKNIEDTLNWDGVKFPSTNTDIQRLEDNNEGQLSINVYHISNELQSNTILLYRRSKVSKATHEIDLLKLEDGNNSHYVFIKNYSRLMSSTSAIFFNLKMYNELVFSLTIGARALYFCEAVMTDKPKCLDFVYKPCNIFEYLINVLSSAKSSIINKQLKSLVIFIFFWYSITLCCVTIICVNASALYSSNKYCSFLLSIFNSFSMYLMISLYASSMWAVGDIM